MAQQPDLILRAEIKNLWEMNWSASQIARKLGRTPGSVMGHVHRMVLEPRNPDELAKRNIPRKPRNKPVIVLEGLYQIADNIVAKDVGHLESEPKAIGPMEAFPASNECRWIHGDPRQYRWQCCGHQVQNGSPYCIHHHARARVKPLTKIRPQ